MAFAHVQEATGSLIVANTTFAIALSPAATAGNLIVINVMFENDPVGLSVTDNASTPNSYVKVATSVVPFGTWIQYQIYGVQVTGGATTITFSWSSPTARAQAVADGFSGNASSNASVVDTNSTGSNGVASTSSSVASFNPTNTGELIVAGIGAGGSLGGFTAGTNYVAGTEFDAVGAMATEWRLSSAASETAPASWSTSARIWGEIAGAYLPPGGVPSSVNFATAPQVMVMRSY